MGIEITRNAASMAMDIIGLRENPVKKMIGRAYVWGTDTRDLPSRERAYYERRIDTEKRKAYVYAGCCFIFADNYCVHVMKSPSWTSCRSRFDGKTKVRDLKKYMKYHESFEHEEWQCA